MKEVETSGEVDFLVTGLFTTAEGRENEKLEVCTSKCFHEDY